MFFKKIPTNLPKVYCEITIDSDKGGLVEFYWLLAYNTLNNFSENFEWKWLKTYNNADYIELDDIYHFLANDNFIPISETFFYRNMETKDQLPNSK